MNDRELEIYIAEFMTGQNRFECRQDPMARNGEPQFHWGYPVGHDFAPNYTSNLQAAFEVVEKLRERWLKEDDHETNYWKIIDCCELGWRVEIVWGHRDGDIPVTSTTDKSLPMAIATCAKLYIKGNEKG